MRFFVADDNTYVRAALRLALEQHTGWQVIGEAADTIHLLAYAARDCPDVIILNPNLPGIWVGRQSGPDSLAELMNLLRWICPKMRLISLGNRPEEQKAFAVSASVCLVAEDERFIGTGRAISDGVDVDEPFFSTEVLTGQD